ncbi:ABC-2 family transporter protein [Pseudovibrio axinellae]|uniref:ABC-2 family transporter protein n=1 Tax=Pseudovibrio axinellae TaxID=989403 RepID=A0A165T197_9HYPH|nr:ABC transporter permease subunit [Pseudovibrio axinellae]KZL05159.1 ABC-2 family transporter protein [Pseudovibrio axinellae]SER50482.1 Cu-processing system permease protein [Pseudovibrio axinellae]
MNAILAFARTEFRIARRNRLLRAAVTIMVLFSCALTLLGSGATGDLGVDLMTASSASLATLSVYIVPLLALLMTFDSIAGEMERGTLPLMLTYPAPRLSMITGKFLAHLAALAVALTLGFGATVVVAAATGGVTAESVFVLLRLIGGALLLGSAFLGLGYALSAWTQATGAAAGYAIGTWLVFVVLYDVALLAGLMVDASGGTFTKDFFPWLLVANPADAFRLVTLPSGQAAELASGIVSSTAASGFAPLISLLLWPIGALTLAWASVQRISL